MSVIDQLQEIYDSLPTIACKGHCWNSCGPIDMSSAERDRIVNLGVLIPTFTEEAAARWAADQPLHCPALNRATRRCDVYEARPLICRVWGVADSMPCEHGCPTTGTLNDRDTYALLLRSFEVGGHRDDRTQRDTAQILAMLDDPTIGPLIARFIRGDRSVIPALEAATRERSKA